MKFGIVSGIFWALDTIVLGIALSLYLPIEPFVANPSLAISGAVVLALVGAGLHDTFCALWMLLYMGVKRRLLDTWIALKSRGGKACILAACLGGPLGMGGYVIAISNIGPATTAIISSFYPALGAALATVFLKEHMRPRQWLALCIAIAAIVVMGVETATETTEGNSLIGLTGAILCVLGWGSEAVLLAWGMRDDAVDNECALQIRETTSAIIYLFLLLPLIGALPTLLEAIASPVISVVGLAAALGITSYLFYYQGIKKIGAGKAMAVNISYSAWSVIFSLIILGKIPDGIEILCCVCILLGTIFAATDTIRPTAFFVHK